LSKKKRIFITRDLTENSIFKNTLEKQGFTIVGKSLISFTATDFGIKEIPDWVFFYSKNGVRFLLEKVEPTFLNQLKIATIGEGTAAFLQAQNIQPDFIGNGKPTETAQQFLKVAAGQKVLFPRARNSKKSIQQLLEKEIEVLDLIVYHNEPKKEVKIDDFDVLVFTSPLNVNVCLKIKQLADNQLVIAIGETTATALKKHEINNYLLPEYPSEKSLSDLILGLSF